MAEFVIPFPVQDPPGFTEDRTVGLSLLQNGPAGFIEASRAPVMSMTVVDELPQLPEIV